MSAMAVDVSWVHALGWSLIHFLWQGALIGILFALAKGVLPKEQSAIRYATGLIALMVLVACPFFTFFVLWSPAALEMASVGNLALAQELVVLPSATIGGADSSGAWLPLLVAGWVAGVFVMLWRGLHQWRALERIATRLAWRQTEIEDMLARVACRFGSLPAVRVLVSACIDTPTLIGWFKPVILLPVAVVTGFPRHQLELILAHELGHLRRYDHLVNLGQAIVETLLFYHPVVHWISREVRHEREICCDNLVLRLTDSEPREYARTLAALENVRQLAPQLAVAASGGILLERVRRIVGAASPRTHSRRSLLGLSLIVASCSLMIPAITVFSNAIDEKGEDAVETISKVDLPLAKPQLDTTILPSTLPVLIFAHLSPVVADRVSSAPPMISAKGSVETIAIARDDSVSGERSISTVAPLHQSVAVPTAVLDDPDFEIPSVGVELAAVEPLVAAPAAPVLLRKISPDYPDNGFGSQHSKVDFEFSIDASGNVHNVRIVAGDVQGAFAVAARNALRQWKFDPRSVSDRHNEKFRQGFEFVSKSYVAIEDVEGHCTPPIGSHVCRPGRGYAALKSEKAATRSARVLAATDESADGADICMPETGSLLCRSSARASVALKVDPDQATAAHTIVIAGGLN
ncbi:MAG: M56 family metallopeptidase [Dokdonella sp.]